MSPFMMKPQSIASACACLCLIAPPAIAQEQAGPVWPKLSAGERAEVMRFGDDFKQFIGIA